MYLCVKGIAFVLFVRFGSLILEMFRQCGIFVFHITIQTINQSTHQSIKSIN